MTQSEHDRELLSRWAAQADEAAFRQLVERYAGLVHGVAFRKAGGQRGLAQEIGQSVFTMLARKAKSLTGHPSLACWLHRAAVLESAHQLRREAAHHRRVARMAAFSPDMISSATPDGPNPDTVPPGLDEALARLRESDRALLLRRFFEDLSYGEIAELSGISEATVRKRMERALSRLAPQLRRSAAATVPVTSAMTAAGTSAAGAASGAPPSGTATTDLTGGFLQAALTHSAPAGFAVNAGHAALTAAPAITSLQLWIHTLRLMTYGKSLTITGAVAALLLAFGGSYSAARHFNSEAGALDGGPGSDPQPPGEGGARSRGLAGSAGKAGGGNPGDSPSRAKLRAQLTAISRTLHADARSRSIQMNMQFGGSEETAGFEALGEFNLSDLEESWAMLPDFKGRRQQFENLAFFLTGLRLVRESPEKILRELQEEHCQVEGRAPVAAMLAASAAWFQTDPAAAWRWRRQAVESGVYPTDRRRPIGAKEVSEWLGRDPQSALAALAPLGPEWDRFTREVLNETLKDDGKRASVWPALEKADDRTALMIADSHPDPSDWSRETLLPWLLTRQWADGMELSRVLNGWTWRDGELDEERFSMLCQSVGELPTPGANEAVLHAVRGVFKGVSPEARPRLLESLVKNAARREQLASQL